MQANGKYILYSDKRDPMLYTTAMSRRARAFELWAAIKYLGSEGIGQLVESLCYHARHFTNQLAEHGFRIINEVVFNQILVACQDEDETLGVLRLIQKDGICWCGETTWKGEKMIRISICSWATTEKDIDLSVESFARSLKGYRQAKASTGICD
jgi:glutamate/tyrosine decarboxylase-like PLP-dependent enzyme